LVFVFAGATEVAAGLAGTTAAVVVVGWRGPAVPPWVLGDLAVVVPERNFFNL
jgi:hypothetical protein